MSFYSSTILLSNSNTINVSNYAPFYLSVDPSGVTTPNLVRQIDYIWGDGTSHSQVLNPNPTSNGDPRNYIQNKQFLSKDPVLSVYLIKVNVYTLGSSDPITFTINLNLQNPQLESNNIFNEFHLVKTKMFGPDNQMLYTFETQNPNNIMMSVVNWKNKSAPLSLPKSPFVIENRPYQLTQPLGLSSTQPAKDITIENPADTPPNPDFGTSIKRLYP
jgi:hypothetical protein